MSAGPRARVCHENGVRTAIHGRSFGGGVVVLGRDVPLRLGADLEQRSVVADEGIVGGVFLIEVHRRGAGQAHAEQAEAERSGPADDVEAELLVGVDRGAGAMDRDTMAAVLYRRC